MLNNFSSKCIKMAKRFAFGTSYGIILKQLFSAIIDPT